MIKDNQIELLDTDLLNNKDAINEVYYWIKMFIAEVGWHYPLDLIWQYNKIMALNLPKGSTILDAGAGNGMMQFILAGNGYNIISVDFSGRKLPILQSFLFNMSNGIIKKFNNEYTEYLATNKKINFGKVLNMIKLFFINFSWVYLFLGFFKKKDYGFIKYIQAEFSDLSFIPSNSIDAIVSTSAIEHNPNHESLKRGICEFNRVLKPNSAMFVTTSATIKECIFDKPTKGYFYDEKTLVDIFQLTNYKSNYSSFSEIYDKIFSCDFLKKNMAYAYKNNPNGGLPFGIWNPKYLPVGIIKWKA